ncbi:MAG TPA: T9SS type A sorting domain-containing protein, partial [Bacteroidota bacterium]|nr:T9SS type A sorting domain-containing protein [Bacteroidota bacterium]
FATLKIYNILGQEVSTVVSEQLGAGTHNRTWNAVNVPSGTYYYELRAGEFVQTRKLQVIK